MEEIEIWRDIKGYEGLYQVSNLGNVISLNYNQTGEIKKLIQSKDPEGRLHVGLCREGKKKSIKVSILVAIAFLGHVPNGAQKLVVDHIDNNTINNRADNLQLITQRLNASKDKINKTSRYTGVHYDSCRSKWFSSIKINGKSKFLGRFSNELDASEAYKNKLATLN